MPTEKPRVTFTISEEKLKILDEYRFSNKIKNQSQAILSLLEKGLDSMENKAALSVTDEATKLAKDYDSLDPHGQRMVRLVADEELRRRELETKAQQDSQGAEAEDTMVYVTQYYRRPMSAGTGQEAGDDAPESLHLKKEPPPGTSYVAPISGDSMEPTYHDGDHLFIHYQEEIYPGQIGVFFMDGQQWIKELGDGILISHNPAYAPRPITEDIRCQGRILWVCDESYFE